MTKFQKRLAAVTTGAALFLQMSAPALAGTSLVITGNGTDSDNEVKLETTRETNVVQNNNADINNKVNVSANTGDNDADKNTGGDVTIATGDASVVIGVKNMANGNVASVGGNGGNGGSLSARILGNGTDSENEIELELGHALDVVQSNEAEIENEVDAWAGTGYNDADKNTGGEVSIETGDAGVLVGIDNMANFNVADVNCDCFIEDIMAKIADNGYDSENKLEADIADSLGIFQDNCSGLPQAGDFGGYHHRGSDCEFDNEVDAAADTGYNDADKNTGESGSDPSIVTGDADATVLLETSGNVNTVGDSHPDVDMEGFDFEFSFDFNFFSNLFGL